MLASERTTTEKLPALLIHPVCANVWRAIRRRFNFRKRTLRGDAACRQIRSGWCPHCRTGSHAVQEI